MSPHPVLLVCDFDETVTVDDTVAVLADVSRCFHSAQSMPDWSSFADYYYQLYLRFAASHVKPSFPPLHASVSTCLDEILAYNTELRNHVELLSLRNVEKHRLFQSLPIAYLQQYVQDHDVLVKSHFKNFINQRKNCLSHQFHILSVNWAPHFIHHVIQKATGVSVPLQNIHCNELLLNANNTHYTGLFANTIVCATDKYNKLHALQLQNPGHHVWYIGDSETDLPSLLKQDVNGILIIDPSDAKTQKKLHYLLEQTLHVAESTIALYKLQSTTHLKLLTKSTNASFYIAKSWQAIDKLIPSPSP